MVIKVVHMAVDLIVRVDAILNLTQMRTRLRGRLGLYFTFSDYKQTTMIQSIPD